MKINLKSAQLHTALFLAKFNLGLGLDLARRPGMRLVWDRADKELLVYFNKEVAIVPSSNVASVVPFNVSDIEDAPKLDVVEDIHQAAPAPVRRKVTAQVSTPTSHVFKGEKNV